MTLKLWKELKELRTEASTYWMVFSVLQESIWGDPGDVMDIRLIGILLICQIFSSQRAKESQNKNEVWNERAPGVASPRNSPRGSKPSSFLDSFHIQIHSRL